MGADAPNLQNVDRFLSQFSRVRVAVAGRHETLVDAKLCGYIRPMKRALFIVTAVSIGCGGSDDGGGPKPEGNVVLTDANNYTSTSTLTIPVAQTAPGADLEICWGGIMKDILCHDMVPTMDIDNVSFLQIQNMSKAQIETKLALGQLTTSQVKIYRDFHVDQAGTTTCTKLSTLSFAGTAANPAQDYAEGPANKYLLLFANGTIPGSGTRTMTFIEPVSTATATSVAAPDGCSSNILDFTADLHTAQPLKIPTAGPWKVDWSSITRDSMGNTVIFQNLDEVLVGFYEGKSVEQLEADFLNIEISATALYQMPVPTGTKFVDLANAKDASGASFPGFDRTNGTWAVAVLCSKCQVPAPIAMSILQPTP
jgi:hypothetical protein